MKNLKKTLIFTVLCTFTVLLFTACGGKSSSDSADVSVDVKQLCTDLEGTIDSEVSEVSNDIIASTYFVDMEKIDEAAAGSNACEVLVLKCKDASYVSEVEDLLKKRVESQSALFASYNAPEVAKLDAALIKSKGNYVVFCVTDHNDKAEEILKEAGL